MKKILLLSLLLVPFMAFADEPVQINGVDEPQWKDFAPPAFINVTEPKGIGKLNDTATYWYKRKVEFESGIEKCRTVEDSEAQFTCYQDLKVKQYQKNSDYNARLEAIEQSKMVPGEMFDRTNNMLPLGNITNMMHFQHNEIK